MKLYLDDKRETPAGWERTFTVEATISLLETRKVTSISLDNDLGKDLQEGYKVLDALEAAVYHDPSFPIPVITIHSDNSSRLEHMKRAIESIERIRQKQMVEIEKKILESIKHITTDLGYTLVSEDWGNAQAKCACAMGCVLLSDSPENKDYLQDNGGAAEAAASILGVSEKWIDSFLDGYDGNGNAVGAELPEAWRMGASIASQTKPISKNIATVPKKVERKPETKKTIKSIAPKEEVASKAFDAQDALLKHLAGKVKV